MTLNRIDKLASANAQFGNRIGNRSSDDNFINGSSADDEMAQAIHRGEFSDENKRNAEQLGLSDNIAESVRYSVAKNKRSQGINQVANSLKIYDAKLKCDVSVAMISNVTFTSKDANGNVLKPSAEQVAQSAAHLALIQSMFDEFLSNIHEQL